MSQTVKEEVVGGESSGGDALMEGAGPPTTPSEPARVKCENLERPSSPESNCAICLEQLHNKSFTDSCLHQFCFTCLRDWAKIKAECPLCKQRFSTIIHNVRSTEDYDQHHLDPPSPPPVPTEPTVLINLAFQRPRFRYRTTMAAGRAMVYIEDLAEMLTGQPSGRVSTHDWRRRRQFGTSEFRRNVYRQGLWVRRSSDPRVRESSPEFYRLNPAQTHRLVPWLNRELNVLLDVSVDSHRVCQEILNLITVCPITSTNFDRAMTRYLGRRTPHFVHEFYNFAISPYDMLAYDLHSVYASVDTLEDPLPSATVMSDSDSDIEVVHTTDCNLPEQLVNIDVSNIAGPSGISEPRAALLIEISDDEHNRGAGRESDDEHNHDAGRDSDDSVQIIGSLPPLSQRTPEIITIDSDEDEDYENGQSRDEIRSPTPSYDHMYFKQEEDDRRYDPDFEWRSRSRSSSSSSTSRSSSSTDSAEARAKRRAKRLKVKRRKKESPVFHPPPTKRKRYRKRGSKRKSSSNRSSSDSSSSCSSSSSSSSTSSREQQRPRLRSVVKMVDKNKGSVNGTSSSGANGGPSCPHLRRSAKYPPHYYKEIDYSSSSSYDL